MRQVMPHRNNIVVDTRSCKSFLRPIRRSPGEFARPVAHLPQSDRLLWMSIILIKTMAYNDLAQFGER